jgi:hypothetical protein
MGLFRCPVCRVPAMLQWIAQHDGQDHNIYNIEFPGSGLLVAVLGGPDGEVAMFLCMVLCFPSIPFFLCSF